MTTGSAPADGVREKALFDYRKKLLEHKEVESRLKESKYRIYYFKKFVITIIIIHYLF